MQTVKKRAVVHLTQAAKCPDCSIEDKLSALCGPSKHVSSAEAYFAEGAYTNVQLSESIIINPAGQAVSILPVAKKMKMTRKSEEKIWSCGIMCRTKDVDLLNRYTNFLNIIPTITLKNISKLKSQFDCTEKHSNKRGHSQICYMGEYNCKSISLPVQILSPHFPSVHYIQRLVYKILHCYAKISTIDKALSNADLLKLQEISEAVRLKVNIVANNFTHIMNLDEEKNSIPVSKRFQSFHKTFDRYPEICMCMLREDLF